MNSKLHSYRLTMKVVELFNRGAFKLHYHEYPDLHIEYTVFIEPLLEKVDGTDDQKYYAVRHKCVKLYRLIRDRILVGHYYTPRTLLLSWKHL